MRKITDLKENEVVHCSTQEEVDKICKLLHDHGLKCNTGRSYLNTNHFNVCSEKGGICYHVFRGTWECRSTVNNVLVYPASDFLQPSYLQLLEEAKELAKQEGMRVEYIVETDWEGVEFVENLEESKGTLTANKIYKITHFETPKGYLEGHTGDKHPMVIGDNGENVFCMKDKSQPSTEKAYKKQLIKEAKDRFGDIKVGDVFERVYCETEPVSYIRNGFDTLFNYYKKYDALTFQGTGIYRNGKWAKRVEKDESPQLKELQDQNRQLKKFLESVKSILKNYE